MHSSIPIVADPRDDRVLYIHCHVESVERTISIDDSGEWRPGITGASEVSSEWVTASMYVEWMGDSLVVCFTML